MPTAVKRRKLAVAPKKAPISGGINTFARISKATPIEKAVLEKHTFVESTATTIVTESLNEKKRKVVESEEDTPITIERKEIKPLRFNSQPSPRTPQNPIGTSSSSSSNDTPTKGARDLFNHLFLSSKTPTRSPLKTTTSFSSTLDASTPKREAEDLPIELLDLINLHAAFLTALSIHYAHNGTHSPADLRMLCPDVARAWGKRRVTLEDIRRTLGVLNRNILEGNKDFRITRLSLSDYGFGKICIEAKHGAGKMGRIARPLNEDVLNEIFVQELKRVWKGRGEGDVQSLVEGLPLEAITTCSSLTKMSPLLAKGQRRLEHLKGGIILKKEEKEKAKVDEVTAGARPTLLERLRAKQKHNATLPPPPTKAELARRAALGRIDEVVSVISILSTSGSMGQSKVSFTMPTVIGKLKDSFKTPISKEEADTCVRLLASEIAPRWTQVIKMGNGKMEALVVNREEKPRDEDIRNAVKCAA